MVCASAHGFDPVGAHIVRPLPCNKSHFGICFQSCHTIIVNFSFLIPNS